MMRQIEGSWLRNFRQWDQRKSKVEINAGKSRPEYSALLSAFSFVDSHSLFVCVRLGMQRPLWERKGLKQHLQTMMMLDPKEKVKVKRAKGKERERKKERRKSKMDHLPAFSRSSSCIQRHFKILGLVWLEKKKITQLWKMFPSVKQFIVNYSAGNWHLKQTMLFKGLRLSRCFTFPQLPTIETGIFLRAVSLMEAHSSTRYQTVMSLVLDISGLTTGLSTSPSLGFISLWLQCYSFRYMFTKFVVRSFCSTANGLLLLFLF